MLYSRDNCVSCDSGTPSCNCAADENCILTSRTCSQCATIQCIKNASSSSSSSVNPGVIAGPIVAVLVIASLALFWYLRRKKRRDLQRLEELAARARKAEAAGFHLSTPNSPINSAHGSGSGSGNLRASNLPQPPPSASRRSSTRQLGLNGGANGKTSPAIIYKQRDPFADRDSYSTEGSARVIPIEYVSSGDGGSQNGSDKIQRTTSPSEAARTLDAARQNLLKPGAGSSARPARPARSPGLDLRLAPTDPHSQDAYDYRSPGGSSAGRIRESYLSEISGSASFLSGNSSDLHVDAPRIITSRQVQVGRLQQAEMVQFGAPGDGRNQHLMEVLGIQANNNKNTSPSDSVRSDPFGERHAVPTDIDEDSLAVPNNMPRTPSSQKTFGSEISGRGPGSEVSGQASGHPSIRTLTPTSRRFDYVEGDEKGLLMSEPPTTADGDLRFSMGSLAFNRDSVSTQGTSWYLASRNGPDGNGNFHSTGYFSVPPPVAAMANHTYNNKASNRPFHVPRESMASSKSAADSLLGAFPMIPPPLAGPTLSSSPLQNPNFPQSTSVTSLDQPHLSRPPVVYRAPASGPGGSVQGGKDGSGFSTRPMTAHSMANSVADSILGSYPFVPPNMDDLAELPSANVPTAVRSVHALPSATAHGVPVRSTGGRDGGEGKPTRNTLALSMASEGLGAFDFSFDRDDELVPPPMPLSRERRL